MSPSESNPDLQSYRLQGVDAVRQAAGAARAFAEAEWLDDDELARLCIVVEELVANLYDHGGLKTEDIVQLGIARDPAGIRVSITDPGAPFDPWSTLLGVDRPDRGGGVGIEIVRSWAEFISYHTTTEGNQLEFLLPIHWKE
mgnify:CR=1 FL=1